MPTLTWAGKEHATKEANSVSYRLLERDESLCYGDPAAGNVIAQGDNLAALKALMPYYHIVRVDKSIYDGRIVFLFCR